MKKTITTPLVLGTLLALSGCGGGSDSITSTADTVNTGTAYYLDSAVEGVSYSCGNQSGVTDNEGKFVFEEGKECQFTLAGIPVKTIPTDKLVDGAQIVEDDLKVAKFLQSIDSDGDPTNGITIDDQVLEALTKALETVTDKAQVIADETVMTEVVAAVGAEVEDVSGDLRSDADVEAHLTQTQTEVTKELLRGKTFYFVDDQKVIVTASVSQDLTTLTFTSPNNTQPNVYNITINGNTITDREGDHIIDKVTKTYIQGHDNHGEWKFYFNRADAEAYLATLSTDQTSSTDLNALVGKTVYQYCTDNSELFQMTFQDNGQIEAKKYNETFYIPYRIDGNTIYTTEDDGEEKDHTLLEWTDKYIKFTSKENYDDGTFYFSEADARANPQSDCDGDSGSYGLDDTINSFQWQTTALRSPNGGESWQNGESRSIQWDTTKIQGATVNCYVLHDNPADILAALENNDAEALKNAVVASTWFKFVNNASNSGNVGIDPQIMQGTGNAYLVLIVSDNGNWDISDSLFSLNQ